MSWPDYLGITDLKPGETQTEPSNLQVRKQTLDPTINPTIDPTLDPIIDPTLDPTINPTNDLDDRTQKSYTVTAVTDVIQDQVGNPFELAGTTHLFTLQDSTVPVLLSKSPVNGATTVVKENPLVFTYNENMVPGTGSVTLVVGAG